jgi:hypothetical protein
MFYVDVLPCMQQSKPQPEPAATNETVGSSTGGGASAGSPSDEQYRVLLSALLDVQKNLAEINARQSPVPGPVPGASSSDNSSVDSLKEKVECIGAVMRDMVVRLQEKGIYSPGGLPDSPISSPVLLPEPPRTPIRDVVARESLPQVNRVVSVSAPTKSSLRKGFFQPVGGEEPAGGDRKRTETRETRGQQHGGVTG